MSAAESTSRQTSRGVMEAAHRRDGTLPDGHLSQAQHRFAAEAEAADALEAASDVEDLVAGLLLLVGRLRPLLAHNPEKACRRTVIRDVVRATRKTARCRHAVVVRGRPISCFSRLTTGARRACTRAHAARR
jgi:type VI protein secretion system component VasF